MGNILFYATALRTPVGPVSLASDAQGEKLTGLWLGEEKYHACGIFGKRVRHDGLPLFRDTQAWLDRYFAKEKPMPSELPLAPQDSAFRMMVWDLLLEIPYGQTTTYNLLAEKIAAKMNRPSMSAQAVGGAVGHNPISIVIPCHRVIGSDGSLTGYAWGLSAKRYLLELEGVRLDCRA